MREPVPAQGGGGGRGECPWIGAAPRAHRVGCSTIQSTSYAVSCFRPPSVSGRTCPVERCLMFPSDRSLGTSALSDVFLTQDRPQSPPTVGLSKSSNVVVAGMGLALGFDYKASPVSGLRSGSSLPFVIQSPFLPEEREERAGTPGKKFN